VFAGIPNALKPPEFTKVKSPVLSLYSDQATADVFPWLEDDSPQHRRATTVLERLRREIEAERARFAREVNGAQVFTYRAHHYQFLSDPADTARRIRVFLSSLRTP
jgi:hypothetical protein